MRPLMLLALPLLLVSCDTKEESKAHDHSMHDVNATSADQAKDPVCGMMIDKAKATKHTHEGADYFLCSDACVVKFKAEPAKYSVHCTCPGTKRACKCDHCGGKEPCDCAK